MIIQIIIFIKNLFFTINAYLTYYEKIIILKAFQKNTI